MLRIALATTRQNPQPPLDNILSSCHCIVMLPDFYTLAHKSLRQAVSDTGVLLGGTDPETLPMAAAPVSEVVAELLSHASHEDHFIEPVLERFLPDIALEITSQHARLGYTIEAVLRQLDALAAEASMPAGGPLALYRAYQRMAAANLIHLDYEETVVMPALWTTAPAESLAEVMAAFNAAHPEAAQLFHRWPDSLTPTEREAFAITDLRHQPTVRS